MIRATLTCLVYLVSMSITAQEVTTVVSNPKIVDGLTVDEYGNVYTTPGGLQNGTEIGLVTTEGKYLTIAKGFSGPIEIARHDGIIYTTNYDDNTLKSYDPNTGSIKNVAKGFDGPAGLVIDDSGNFYITCFGAPPRYSGNEVYKVSPDGEKEVIYRSNKLFRPQGIALIKQELYVADFNGKVMAINLDSREARLLADVKTNTGNMVHKGTDLYLTAIDKSQILKISINDGKVEVFAGTGKAGIKDGPRLEAQFVRPLGLAFNSDKSMLYLSEGARQHRLRKIIMP